MEKWIKKLKAFFSYRIGIKEEALADEVWRRLLRERMQLSGIEEPEAYFRFMSTDPHESQELLEEVVVPESWFFREVRAFRLLARKKPKRLLSLACSTGEEPYSFLMTLADEGEEIQNVVVDALDISKKALVQAKEGIYPENSFRGKEHPYRERYFRRQGELYLLDERLKKSVRFHLANLADPNFTFPAPPYDMIFCRNLLIYLHAEAQRQLLEKIEGALAEGGILITAAAESEIVRRFGMVPQRDFPSLLYFKKKGREQQQPLVTPLPQEGLEKIIEERFDEERAIQEARRFADLACYDRAAEICRECLERHGVSSRAYFLLGMIRQATGSFDEAEEFFKKALYLEPEHRESLLHLALLADRKNDAKRARLYRDRAMRCGDG